MLTKDVVTAAFVKIRGAFDSISFESNFTFCSVDFRSHNSNTVVAIDFDEDGNYYTSASSTVGGAKNLVVHTAALQRAINLVALLGLTVAN